MVDLSEKTTKPEAEPIALEASLERQQETANRGEQEEIKPSKEPVKRRCGFASGFLGGVVGSGIVGVAVFSLYSAGHLQPFFQQEGEESKMAQLLILQEAATNRAEEALSATSQLTSKSNEMDEKITALQQNLMKLDAWLIDYGGVNDEAVRDLSDRMLANSGKIDGLERDLAAQRDLVNERVAALEAGLADDGGANDALLHSMDSQISANRQALDALSRELAAIREQTIVSAGGGDADGQADLSAIGSQLAALDQRIQALDNELGAQRRRFNERDDALTRGLVALQEEVDAPASRDHVERAAALGAIDNRLATFGEKIDALERELQQQRDLLANQGSAIEISSQSAAATQSSLEMLRGNVQELHEALAALPTAAQNANDNNMALLIAANSLKAAVERGGSYINELQIFKAIAPDDLSLEVLEGAAESGLPTAASLSANFTTVADQIAATENSLSPDAGWDEKVWNEVQGLYSQRPVGNVEGANAVAIAARMEVAIAEGDYARALSEWAALPEEAKTLSADFVVQLQARVAVEQLLTQIIARSLGQEVSQTSSDAAVVAEGQGE